MSLVAAIDALLAFINRFREPERDSYKPWPRGGEEYREFLRLDSVVFVEAFKAGLVEALPPEVKTEDGSIGRTRLPVIRTVWALIPNPQRWETDLLTLRSLAEPLKQIRPSNKMSNGAQIEVLLGEESKQIREIANSNRSVEEKMRLICAIDRRCVGFNCKKWATLLRVSKSAVVQTQFWKHIKTLTG